MKKLLSLLLSFIIILFITSPAAVAASENDPVVYVVSAAAVQESLKYNITAISDNGLPISGLSPAEAGAVAGADSWNGLSSLTEQYNDLKQAALENPRGIDPEKPMVAITYDDGPHKTNTPALLDLMEEYGVVATFFEVGSRLEIMPQFLKRMEELGCEIGNHSYSHSNLARLTSDQIEEEIEKTNAIIREEIGHDATLVRTPGGSVNETVESVIGFPLINWTVDTLDWKYHNADYVYNAVTGAGDLDGKIVLMHSLYSSTVEASKRLIPWLIEQGYQLVTVSELAEYRGTILENGTVYNKF